MGVKRARATAKDQPNGDMLRRLQGMLYEFHDMGRFEEARPHILWLMEIVEAAQSQQTATAPSLTQALQN